VEHIGSTAVLGLVAKPILDLSVALAAEADTESVFRKLEQAGYTYRGDAGDEGGLVFVLDARPLHRIAHVHAIRHGDAQWRRYLDVRDRLRSDPRARAAYADLKRDLATKFPHNRAAYTAAKTEFIQRLSAPD
jgi:GrpB-like predicted nucleotidyltransferase (UPF0157 family)